MSGSGTDGKAEGEDRVGQASLPPLRLIRGDASPEELAALLAVLSAAGDPGESASPGARSQWAARDRGVRRTPTHGPGAWRTSAWPR